MTGTMHIADHQGDTTHTWDTTDPTTVQEIEETFRKSQATGRLVYRQTGDGTGEQVRLDTWNPEEHTELFVARVWLGASGSFRASRLAGVSSVAVLEFQSHRVYYPHMASVIEKRRADGRTYYYLVESARVDGKPRIVSQQYLGSAAEVAEKLAGASAGTPIRSQHKRFGDLAAVWSVLERLGVAEVIDAVGPDAPTRAPPSAPTSRWPARTGSSRRAPSSASPTGGPPPPGRAG